MEKTIGEANKRKRWKWDEKNKSDKMG